MEEIGILVEKAQVSRGPGSRGQGQTDLSGVLSACRDPVRVGVILEPSVESFVLYRGLG